LLFSLFEHKLFLIVKNNVKLIKYFPFLLSEIKYLGMIFSDEGLMRGVAWYAAEPSLSLVNKCCSLTSLDRHMWVLPAYVHIRQQREIQLVTKRLSSFIINTPTDIIAASNDIIMYASSLNRQIWIGNPLDLSSYSVA
jgi:hypothetical protein